MEVLDFPSMGHGWKLLSFDDPSPKPLATRTAVPALASSMLRVAEGLVLKLLSINSLSSDSNVDLGAPWDASENRDVPLTTR